MVLVFWFYWSSIWMDSTLLIASHRASSATWDLQDVSTRGVCSLSKFPWEAVLQHTSCIFWAGLHLLVFPLCSGLVQLGRPAQNRGQPPKCLVSFWFRLKPTQTGYPRKSNQAVLGCAFPVGQLVKDLGMRPSVPCDGLFRFLGFNINHHSLPQLQITWFPRLSLRIP